MRDCFIHLFSNETGLNESLVAGGGCCFFFLENKLKNENLFFFTFFDVIGVLYIRVKICSARIINDSSTFELVFADASI